MALPEGDHVVNGTLTGFEVKNGWHKFSVLEEGMQYPVKADTKKPDVINAALALVGQPVSIKVTRKDSGNPNPNAPGTNYINTYLNEIGALSAGAFPNTSQPAQQGQAQQAQAPRGGGNEDPIRALRIARMNGAQHAVGMLAAGILPESQQNMSGLVEVAEAWVAYTLLGPQRFDVAAFNAPPTAQAPAQEEPPPPEEPPANVHPITGELLPEGYTVRDGNVFDASGFPAAF
jgi:hypothetical protein